MIKLNIGCGNNLKEDYINIDAMSMSFFTDKVIHQLSVRDLPTKFEANSVDEVYASHLFEHFTHFEITTVLYKIWSVLKPGGKLTIITPEFKNLLMVFEEKHVHGDFSMVDILHLKVFSTKDETLHKSVWTESIGNWYITRENLFQIPTISYPSVIEIEFNTRKI